MTIQKIFVRLLWGFLILVLLDMFGIVGIRGTRWVNNDILTEKGYEKIVVAEADSTFIHLSTGENIQWTPNEHDLWTMQEVVNDTIGLKR